MECTISEHLRDGFSASSRPIHPRHLSCGQGRQKPVPWISGLTLLAEYLSQVGKTNPAYAENRDIFSNFVFSPYIIFSFWKNNSDFWKKSLSF